MVVQTLQNVGTQQLPLLIDVPDVVGTVDEQTAIVPDQLDKPKLSGLKNLDKPVSHSVIVNPASLGLGVTK